MVKEFAGLALLTDAHRVVGDLNVQPLGGKGSGEDNRAGVLANVDETTGSSKTRAKARNIDVARCIGLGKAQTGQIESAAIIEVELIVLRNDRIRVDRRAKIKTGAG
ncbi:hypothetical protein [Jannaschia sp. 2305UL9-9]|uniref:hypothetical protein n=1 Tax=Jannaschia sp. 2305UL9-9 TaxID=3121638 RepID=UPI0035293BFF